MINHLHDARGAPLLPAERRLINPSLAQIVSSLIACLADCQATKPSDAIDDGDILMTLRRAAKRFRRDTSTPFQCWLRLAWRRRHRYPTPPTLIGVPLKRAMWQQR